MIRIIIGILLVVFPLLGCSQSDSQIESATASKAPKDTVAILGTGADRSAGKPQVPDVSGIYEQLSETA